MEDAIQNRISSLDKFKSVQQRRRRMSFVAPVNDKGIELDFEERIAICEFIKRYRNYNLFCSFSR